jgi:hypothetical protein
MSLLVLAAIPMQRLMIKRRSADAPAAINIMQMTGVAGKVHREVKRGPCGRPSAGNAKKRKATPRNFSVVVCWVTQAPTGGVTVGKAKGRRERGKKTRCGSASGGRRSRSRSRSRRGDGGWMGKGRRSRTRDWWQTLLKALAGWMLHLAREQGRRIQMRTRLNICGPVPCVARTFLTYIPTLGKCAPHLLCICVCWRLLARYWMIVCLMPCRLMSPYAVDTSHLKNIFNTTTIKQAGVHGVAHEVLQKQKV